MGLLLHRPVKLLKANKLWWVFVFFMLFHQYLTSVFARPSTNNIYDRLTRGLIRPLSCYDNKTGETGICMFTLNCFQARGSPLTTCKDGIFVGSCCQLPYNPHLPEHLQDLPDNDLNPTTHFETAFSRWKSSTTHPSSSLSANQASIVTSFDVKQTTYKSIFTTSRSSITKTTLSDNQLINGVLGFVQSETNSPQNIANSSWKVTPSDSSSTMLLSLVTRIPVTTIRSPQSTTVKPSVVNWAVSANRRNMTTTTQRYKPFYHTPPSRKPISTTTNLFSSSKLPESVFLKTSTTTRRPITTVKSQPTTIQTTTTPSTTTEFNLATADYKEACGRTFYEKNIVPTARIVGGRRSVFGKWPWQVSLRQWKKNTFQHKCGAALLNENWAISAAHCVDNVPVEQLQVRIGDFDVNDIREALPHLDRQVQIIAKHPDFNPRNFENDLALVRFYEPIHFQHNIIPICIPHNDNSFVNDTAFVTGWGRLFEDGPLPDQLYEAQIPIISNLECEKLYRQAGYIESIPDIFICAGRPGGGVDSCEGDSGGPMVIRGADQRWTLAGVISWGIGCAEPNQPGVYTRISRFRDWINAILVF